MRGGADLRVYFDNKVFLQCVTFQNKKQKEKVVLVVKTLNGWSLKFPGFTYLCLRFCTYYIFIIKHYYVFNNISLYNDICPRSA
ncbi:Zinc finger CCCH domain-containing protein 7B [Labeo rohita]|uniref:Zinc finger CCCH domain-containing protein 7B n=1 Tax=Labeo rohita TaxID=84645 RepID=A0ABQ8N0E0_LABRO|nr:Zinc finger CCCH domain-containing protein 7B [Labeo rohita]